MKTSDYERALKIAIKAFWTSRDSASRPQGSQSGKQDTGNRRAVTAGGHLNGLVDLIVSISQDAGAEDAHVFYKGHGSTILPGFFRATKDWDVVVVSQGQLIACIELKSQVGSFGNNFNNRTEESIGSATDFWTAYREGAFTGHTRPFLGYLTVLEDCPASIRPVRVSEPHFKVFPEFRKASYEQRYAQLCLRLVRERLYDSACLLLADRARASQGGYREHAPEIGFSAYASSLWAHVHAHTQNQG